MSTELKSPPSNRAMKSFATAAAACWTLALTAAAQAQGQPLQGADIVDARGFGQPVTAAVLEVPVGWRTEGGVNWDRSTNCINNQMRIEWRATSPDNTQAFEIMHGFNWQVQGTQIQMNPCPAMPFRSARAFLEAVVQQRRPGARVLEYRDRPEVAQAAARAAQTHPQIRLRHDAGQLLIGYQVGGSEVREVLATSVTFSEAQGNVVGGTAMVSAQRAPAGRLDEAQGQRIAGSMKANPHWLAMMKEATTGAERRFSSNQRAQIDRWHAAEMARINARGAADRAGIRAQTSRDIANMQSATQANTQATNDRIQRRNLEGLGEYNTHRDTDGGAVRSSIHGGERVLRNGNGSYSSTNDPNYNPAGSTELQRVR